jgi:hypothetical protein
MKIPKLSIEEYQQAYFEEYGVRLTEKEAEQQAQKVLSLMKFIFNSKS